MGDENVASSSSSSSRHGSPLLVRRRQSQFGMRSLGLELSPQTRVLVEQQPKHFCEQVLEKMSLVEARGSSLLENLKQLVQNRYNYIQISLN